jgi:hypothetical protein
MEIHDLFLRNKYPNAVSKATDFSVISVNVAT